MYVYRSYVLNNKYNIWCGFKNISIYYVNVNSYIYNGLETENIFHIFISVWDTNIYLF